MQQTPLDPASRPTHLSDTALIDASLDEPERFGLLFDRHHQTVFRYVRSRIGDLADDVVGDTFAEAFRSRSSFDPDRGTSSLPWLLGIATNMVDRRRAAERRWLRPPPADRAELGDDPVDLDERISTQLLAPWLVAALAQLRRRDRTALLLHVAGDLSVEEVAQALDVPVGTIKSRLHRARRILAANLEVHR